MYDNSTLGSHVGLDSTDSSVVCFFIAVSSCLCQAVSLVGEVDPNVKTKVWWVEGKLPPRSK